MKNWKKWIKSLGIEPNTDAFRDPGDSVCARCPAQSTCPLYHDDLSNEERTVDQVCNEHFVKWSMGEAEETIEELVPYVKNTVKTMLSKYLFEPKDAQTRSSIKSDIDKFLSDICRAGRLHYWGVVCDETNNTSTTIDKNEVNIDIYLQPTKARNIVPIKVKMSGGESIDIEAEEETKC